MKKKLLGMLVMICLLVGFMPTNMVAQAAETATIKVMYNGAPLDGAEIKVSDLNNVLDSSSTGELVTTEKASGSMTIEVTLPTGYEFMWGGTNCKNLYVSDDLFAGKEVVFPALKAGVEDKIIHTFEITYAGKVIDDADGYMEIWMRNDEFANNPEDDMGFFGTVAVSGSSLTQDFIANGNEKSTFSMFLNADSFGETGYVFANAIGEEYGGELDLTFAVSALSNKGKTTFKVTNPVVDGTLSTNLKAITLEQGEIFDISSADACKAKGLQIFHTAPNGTKKEVIYSNVRASEWNIDTENGVLSDTGIVNVDDKGIVSADKVGTSEIVVEYNNALYLLPITVTEASTEGGNDSNTTTETIPSTDNKDIVVSGTEELIPDGGKFTVTTVTSGTAFDKAVEAVKAKIKDLLAYKVYEMTLTDSNNVEIHELNGYVTVTLPIPEGLTAGQGKTLTVYRLEANGALTKCETSVADGKISFKTNHFSTYIIAEEEAAVTSPKTVDAGATWMRMGIVLSVAGIAALVYGRKKWLCR